MEAQRALEASGWPPPVPHEVIAKFVLAKRGQGAPDHRMPESATSAALRASGKRRSATSRTGLVRAYCFKGGKDFAAVNADLNNRVGISKLRHATEDSSSSA